MIDMFLEHEYIGKEDIQFFSTFSVITKIIVLL